MMSWKKVENNCKKLNDANQWKLIILFTSKEVHPGAYIWAHLINNVKRKTLPFRAL